jgi:MFS family permease
MMLAGRALQGVGSGVILSLVEIILADLVPLSERFVCQCRCPSVCLINILLLHQQRRISRSFRRSMGVGLCSWSAIFSSTKLINTDSHNDYSTTGPPIGGGLAASNWRWLFYLNLPLTGIVMIIVALFVNLKVPKGTMREKLGKMDWTGNAIFIPAITYVAIHKSFSP